MRRLALLCALAAAATAQTAVTIAAHPDRPGAAIPRDFIGLSFESGSLTSATGFPAENPVFRQMVSQIGPGLARFGGNSVDRLTGWTHGSSTDTTVMTASDADRVFAWARAAGWRVLWSVGLGHTDSAAGADEAAYVYQTAADVLAGLEIGNEPDLYHSNGMRPSSYNINDYIQEWQTYADAIQAQTPEAVLTGSAAAGSIGTWTKTFAQQMGSRIALLTQHLYPLAPYSNNPNAGNAATVPHILGATARNTEDNDGAQLLSIAQGQKIPWRMAETNSCYNGGQSGVSNVFASALWGVDYMFTLAGRSAAGVNFHGGGSGAYTPIAVSGSQVTARPLYYALLMFRAAGRGRVVPLDVAANGVNLTAYGALDPDGTLRVVITNKDMAQDAAVTVTPGAGYTAALEMFLTAPAVDSTTGVTLGDAAVGADGTWLPAQLTSAAVAGGSLNIAVPAASAALVAFGNGRLGVANAATGKNAIAVDGLASAYGEALGIVETSSASAPQTLAGMSGTITDSAGVARPVSLTYAGTSQVNFVVPNGTALGPATVQFGTLSAPVTVAAVAPGLFTMGGSGVAAAIAVRVPNGQSTQTAVPVFNCSSGSCVPVPIAIDNQSTVYVSLYGTGIRGAGSSIACTAGGIPVQVTSAGAQGEFPGLDQVNIAIPTSLRGRGVVDVVITTGGQTSNTVRLEFGG